MKNIATTWNRPSRSLGAMNFIVTIAQQPQIDRFLSSKYEKHRNSLELAQLEAWCDEFHRYR
ncbi:hypothetical protein [Cohnella soli]|uniref:Uncharacterized protein n=1 Tax=Cohnella soli TaxID=425005 RepID=A0ABW0I4E1_9BACL